MEDPLTAVEVIENVAWCLGVCGAATFGVSLSYDAVFKFLEWMRRDDLRLE